LACGEDLTRSRPHGSQGTAWQAGGAKTVQSRLPVQPKRKKRKRKRKRKKKKKKKGTTATVMLLLSWVEL
jgi:hypothetical protein